VRPDGRFKILVPGDRPVTVRAWHPILVAGPRGSKVISSPVEDILLELVLETSARFIVEPAPKPTLHSEIRVLLYEGLAEGPPVSEHVALIGEDGSIRFGGFKPGSWTLWIDVPDYAPLTLRDVALGAGQTDLGLAPLSRGSSVRVTVLTGPNVSVPRIGVFAFHQDAPQYTRGMNSRGGAPEAVLHGLGPGRFKVRFSTIMGGGGNRNREETIVVDGKNDAQLTLDLR
jgi:hypothetical protein